VDDASDGVYSRAPELEDLLAADLDIGTRIGL
jgi:hypothetical protein